MAIRGISLPLETVNEEIEKIKSTILPDKKNDARRIRRHIFNTDGHLAINATSIKLGDRRYPKDKRVVMKHIHGTEEMTFDA